MKISSITKSFTLYFLFFLFLVLIMFRVNSQLTETENKNLETPTQILIQAHLEVKGSIPYWDQDKAFLAFEKNAEVFSYINLFWYYVTKQGGIGTYQYAKEDKSIIDFAHKNNVKVFAVVTNLPDYDGATWSSNRVENVIDNEKVREKNIDNIITKLEELNFDGVIIDFEEVDASHKENFSRFIEVLSDQLHMKGKLVAVALHPKTADKKKGEEIGLFQDWKELSLYADQLNIMAYNEHWDESSFGPIASLPWIKKIVAYVKTLKLPEEKIFLGIPLYGYDWKENSTDAAKGLTYQDVKDLANVFKAQIQWDSQGKSPYFQYKKNNITHHVWFENAASIREKIILTKQAGFKGITFWRLGGEDSEIWDVVKALK